LFSELSLIFKEYKKRAGKEHIGLKIQDHYDPLVSVIITDKVKLKQIFVNLIGNAFKFTEKGKIQVGCKPDEKNNLLFFVSDSGIGIPTDKKDKIFEHFIQLDNGTNRLYGGTGIGLSIVKGFIKLLGGEIWLESELHIGTTFYFTIPINITQTLQPETIAVRPYSDYNFGPKTILIVEDDIYNAEYLKEILKEQGFTIIHTLFGHEAIELSRLNPLDMVLMDISLPDMNGYEATRQIKIFKPNLEIIAQTAYSDPEDKQRAFEAGCNAYITKPIERDVLLSVIKNHLSNQKLVN